MGKRQIAVVAALVALAFSAGVAQSGLARVNELPPAFGSAAVEFGHEPTGLAHRGPFGGGRLLTAAAGYIGISEEDLRTQLQAGKSLAEIAVGNGKTRDGLIAALAAVATERIGKLVDQKGPFGPAPGFRNKGVQMGVKVLYVATDYLGITREQLTERLRAGESLGQVANATAGKSRDGLVDAIVRATNTRIDEALGNKRITEDQAAKMRENAAEMAERIVDADARFKKGDFRKGGRD